MCSRSLPRFGSSLWLSTSTGCGPSSPPSGPISTAPGSPACPDRYGAGVACRITELVLDCRDPTRLAAFWCEVLGWKVLDTEPGAVEIGPEGGDGGPQPVIV